MHESYTKAVRHAIVESSGLMPTTCRSLKCAEISTQGRFCFRLQLKSWDSRLGIESMSLGSAAQHLSHRGIQLSNSMPQQCSKGNSDVIPDFRAYNLPLYITRTLTFRQRIKKIYIPAYCPHILYVKG